MTLETDFALFSSIFFVGGIIFSIYLFMVYLLTLSVDQII
jgi:hypothetical protein